MKLLQITGSSWILFFANVRFWWPWKHQWNLWVSNVFIEDQKGTSRSSRWHMFFKILKYVLKNSAILTGKHLCWSQLFSCEYCKIFMNSFFIEHRRWLLLGHRKEKGWTKIIFIAIYFKLCWWVFGKSVESADWLEFPPIIEFI